MPVDKEQRRERILAAISLRETAKAELDKDLLYLFRCLRTLDLEGRPQLPSTAEPEPSLTLNEEGEPNCAGFNKTEDQGRRYQAAATEVS
jgi:hypothetical protein